MKPLNLASRPFRNERLPATLFGVACALLLGVTVWHALQVRSLLPAKTGPRHRRLAALEAQVDSLREEGRRLRAVKPKPDEVAHWMLVKDLVDHRAFSWTGLLGRLEELLPDDVRLVSITPRVRKGQVGLDVTAVVRRPQAGWELVRILEARGDFSEVYPTSEEAEGQFRYTMRYWPQAASAPGPRRRRTAATPAAAEVPE